MSRPRAHPKLTDRRWLVRQYEARGRSSRAIAEELGCSQHTVQSALRGFGIRLRGPSRPPLDRRLSDPRWLAQWPGRTLRSLAEEVGCGQETVRRALRRHGLADVEGRRTVMVIYPQLADSQWLENRYAEAGSPEIAVEIGCTPGAVLTALRRHGIPLRSTKGPARLAL